MKKTDKPLLIVLTPVRNEAWILRAFLSATSLWADYIIIADQMSTDGSREIAKSFPKVRLIENNREDIHMGDVRCMLMEEARRIPGDKILFTLDADEFWSGDFMHTKSWEKIIHSQPDDVFLFKWMNLRPGLKEYVLEPKNEYFNWVTHASNDFFDGAYPKNRFIHEWRLRWSPKSTSEKCYNVDEIRAIHFGEANIKRTENKGIYYAVSSIAIPNKEYNLVSLYRQYHPVITKRTFIPMPNDIFDWYKSQGVDVLQLIDMSDVGQYYTDRVLYYIHRDGAEKYAILDIWDEEFCSKHNLPDPRKFWQKLVHLYLRKTRNVSHNIIVRVLDKSIKWILRISNT